MNLNRRIFAGGMLLVIPMLWVFINSFGRDPHRLPSTLEQRPAPTFTLQTMNGETFSLSKAAGKPVVLNFWSTWCKPCKLEHGLLQAGPTRYPNTQFVGVLYSDTPDKAIRYLNAAGSAYPNLIDPQGRVAIDYGVTGVPETFFINSEGDIAYKHTGPLSSEILHQWLGEKK